VKTSTVSHAVSQWCRSDVGLADFPATSTHPTGVESHHLQPNRGLAPQWLRHHPSRCVPAFLYICHGRSSDQSDRVTETSAARWQFRTESYSCQITPLTSARSLRLHDCCASPAALFTASLTKDSLMSSWSAPVDAFVQRTSSGSWMPSNVVNTSGR